MKIDGITVNIGEYLENINPQWADQLSIYSWVLGHPVGSSFIGAIDQIVKDAKGRIRVAEHRMRVSADYQHDLLHRCATMWQLCREGPRAMFLDAGMTPNESEARCKVLDKYHEAFEEPQTDNDEWFARELRGETKSW
jgi:hypothetical protein